MTKAKGSFELAGWDETTYEELDGGGKLTRASVKQNFDGAVVGDGAVEWLMSYRNDGTARFVGLQLVRGTVEDRKGTFVLETVGDFDGDAGHMEGDGRPGFGNRRSRRTARQGEVRRAEGTEGDVRLRLRARVTPRYDVGPNRSTRT